MYISWWAKLREVRRHSWKSVAQLADSETYTKTRISLFLVLLGALVFWQQLLGLYNQYIVVPVLSRVAYSKPTDVAIGLLDVAIILFFVAKIRKAYQLSTWQQAALLIPGLLYVAALRYTGIKPVPNWHFYVFGWNSHIRYADALLLQLAGGIALIGYTIWQRLAAARPSASYLQEDIPITCSDDDTLNRGPEAQRVAQQITSLATSASFAIGILGKWGEGKSSFLKLIEWQLGDKEIIIIHFNPWLVESTAAIRKDFFSTLKERLGEYSGELATEINTYANGLASVYDNTAAKALKEAVSFLWDTPTLTEQFKKVNRVIASLRKKVVIFIDDIDRLDKDEVLETLRIVRNTASFGNTIFVLAYDKEYVTNAVQLTNQANSGQYLDKIVQLEIPLSRFDAVKLARRTLDIIQHSSPELQVYHDALRNLLIGTAGSKPTDTFWQYYSTPHSGPVVCFYPEIITTMRSAIRFTNLFTFDFLPLAKEVRLDEMVNLTLLKFKYPALYEAIKYERVVEAGFAVLDGYTEGVIKLNEAALSAFYDAHPIEKADSMLLDRVLKYLFGSDRLVPGERTIQRPSSFAVYFSAGYFANVSLAQLEELRLGPVENIKPRLTAWHAAQQLEEAFDVLLHVQEFNNRADFENVVVAVLEAGKLLDRDVVKWLLDINSKHQQLVETLYGQNAATFRQFLEQLFAQAEFPYLFEANLAFGIKAEFWRKSLSNFPLTVEQLNLFTLNYLCDYLATTHVVDNIAFRLYQCNGTAVDASNYIIIYEAANEPMRQAIEKYLDSALHQLIIPTGQPPLERHLTFRPFLNQIFGSQAAVDAFIDALPDSEAAQRVKADYQLYKAAGYSEFEKPGSSPEEA